MFVDCFLELQTVYKKKKQDKTATKAISMALWKIVRNIMKDVSHTSEKN